MTTRNDTPDDQARKLDQLSRKHDKLLAALKAILETYVNLVNSGDAGNWDCETEPAVMNARAAIAACEKQTESEHDWRMGL